MKKIAFVISSMSSGGAERVVSILSNHICNRYEVFIITMIKQDSFYALHPNITLLHCAEKIEPSQSIAQALKSNFMLYRAIVGYIKHYKIDLCVGFMTPNNILATFAAKRCGIPVVISERNNPYVESQNLSAPWKYLRKVSYPRANALVVQTEKIKSFYDNTIKANRLFIIPNPINPEFNSLALREKRNIILNVGRLTEQKNQEMLIRAFAKTKIDTWCLKIVGEGELRKQLESLIENLEMQDKIVLVGRQAKVEEFYKEARIFAFSSNYEGFPNALQEAMYFGLPCVSTDCPSGPSDLIENEKNGFLIPIGDEAALSEKLNLLMENDMLRTTLGVEARKTMVDYEVDQVVEKWVVLFDRFLQVQK